MRRFFVALLLVSCGPHPVPPGEVPGDEGAIGWEPPARVIDGPVIDCGGGEVPFFAVREAGTTVRNCIVRGGIRVRGPASNDNAPMQIASSREADHVARTRAAAPAWVTIEDTVLIGTGQIPLYVGPGVSMLTVRRTTIQGESVSTMAYLDAESHGVRFEDVVIDAYRASREAVAIDASDGHVFAGVVIRNARHGGVYAYRNCGEARVARIATPSDMELELDVRGAKVGLWLGSREGQRSYCDDDADGSFGSSISDYDWARRNVVSIHTDGLIREGVSASGNVIKTR